MGIYDRDYFRHTSGSREQFGQLRMWSITTWLIVINVAVYLIDALLLRSGTWVGVPLGNVVVGDEVRTIVTPMGPLEAAGHFSAATAIWQLQVWRFLTFQFLHANFQHLLFNMLGLYFFGQMMEAYLGRQRFLTFYLLCGIAGAVSYLVLWMLGLLVSSPRTPLVGASAGIFGILAAASQVAPRATVMLAFPPMPVQLRTWAYVLLGISIITVVFFGQRPGANAGGEAAHLGGAVLGMIMIKSPTLLSLIGPHPGLKYRRA